MQKEWFYKLDRYVLLKLLRVVIVTLMYVFSNFISEVYRVSFYKHKYKGIWREKTMGDKGDYARTKASNFKHLPDVN